MSLCHPGIFFERSEKKYPGSITPATKVSSMSQRQLQPLMVKANEIFKVCFIIKAKSPTTVRESRITFPFVIS